MPPFGPRSGSCCELAFPSLPPPLPPWPVDCQVSICIFVVSVQLRNFCALWLLFCSLVIQFICNARKFVVKVKRFLSHFSAISPFVFTLCLGISGQGILKFVAVKALPQASLRGLNASFKLLTSDPREMRRRGVGRGWEENCSAWQATPPRESCLCVALN